MLGVIEVKLLENIGNIIRLLGFLSNDDVGGEETTLFGLYLCLS